MSELDALSKIFLSLISHLDHLNADSWSLRTITATSAAIFLGMRASIGHKYDIDWDAVVHAIVSGVGAAICIYLNRNAAVEMNGITGMCVCVCVKYIMEMKWKRK